MILRERAHRVLRANPVLGDLDQTVLSDVVDLLVFQSVRAGTCVLREGEPATEMVFVMSGCLRVARCDAQGRLSLYNEVRPGQSIGEVNLMLQQACTADVVAMRDSELAVLSLANFEALVMRHPLALSRVVARSSHFAYGRTPQRDSDRYAQSFVVMGLRKGVAVDGVARALVRALSQRGRVAHVPWDASAPVPGSTAPLSDHPQRLWEDSSDFVVYEAPAEVSAWTRRAVRQADQVVFVDTPRPATGLTELEASLAEEAGYPLKRKHLVLLHLAQDDLPRHVAGWRAEKRFERVYPIRENNVGDFSRLSRFLTGDAVGVVLGGGGARGFAHLGILQALEEVGVPIDMLGGNSMGALLGAQYLCGASLPEIAQATTRFALGGERPTLPFISLLSGRRVERDLQRMFGDRKIEEMWQPFFSAACNLTQGTTTAVDCGPLWRAVLASNSPAGLFPPVPFRGELLVDGAILDNVPVQAMRVRLGTPLEKRKGNGTVIAVDVDPQSVLATDPEIARLSRWRTLKGYFHEGAYPAPGIADILYRASHIGAAQQRPKIVANADVYLEPPVGMYALMGYQRAPEIVEVGYRHALEKLEQWNSKKS